MRDGWMKSIVIPGLLIIQAAFSAGCENYLPVGGNKPNVIVIFTDDQGFADLGIQGQVADISTPHIDALAEDGIRMTSGYVTAPQCTPSRAGIISGQYQQRLGVDHNGTIPIPLNATLLPHRMKSAGYVTGMVGKWHLDPNHTMRPWLQAEYPQLANKPDLSYQDISFDMRLPYFPAKLGFDETFHGSMNNYWANFTLQGKSIAYQYLNDTRFRLDVQSDAALSFISRNRSQPFFLYLAYFAPHIPLQATEEYLSRFPGNMPERRRYCLAMMSAIDDGVGRIVSKLKDYGIYDNTIIFFISDNGAPLKLYKEDLPIEYAKASWDGSLNDPLVGEKGMISEGGVRVPFIMSWPGMLPKGVEYDEPVISLDVAATAVAAAGLEHPVELDGVNLVPYLMGLKEGPPHDALYWRFWSQSAVRSGDWKYLKAGANEYLFNLGSDGVEDQNLILQEQEKAMELRLKLEDWAEELYEPGVPEGPLNQQEIGWYDFYFN